MRRFTPLVWPVALLLGSFAMAQSSASYELEEHVLNAGGTPSAAVDPSSASFRITLSSLGEPLAPPGTATSASYAVDSAFTSAYRPPGEATRLRFDDDVTLRWDPERSVGSYNLYRDSIGNLSGLGYGVCLQQDLPDARATDSDPVPSGDGFFYLATAVNRLDEEGTKGFQGDGTERAGAVCP
jgi:hypothetical protein